MSLIAYSSSGLVKRQISKVKDFFYSVELKRIERHVLKLKKSLDAYKKFPSHYNRMLVMKRIVKLSEMDIFRLNIQLDCNIYSVIGIAGINIDFTDSPGNIVVTSK